RNDPDPPAAPEKMICGPFTRGSTLVRVIGKAFPPFVAVPLFDATEPRPHRVRRVLGIRAKMSELSREHRRAACSIDDPTARGHAFLGIENSVNSLSITIV